MHSAVTLWGVMVCARPAASHLRSQGVYGSASREIMAQGMGFHDSGLRGIMVQGVGGHGSGLSSGGLWSRVEG